MTLYVAGWNSSLCWNVPTRLSLLVVQVCFDHKPRIISKTNKDDPSFCSHPVTKHNFENHKWVLSHLLLIEPRPKQELDLDWFCLFVRCLVHILKETTVRYTKIRPMSPVYQLDVCRHEVRYGCVREDDCFYAHSLVELKVWMLQQQRGKNTCTEGKKKKRIFRNRCDFLIFLLYCSLKGITQEGIVQEAKTFWNATDLPQAATVMLRFILTLRFINLSTTSVSRYVLYGFTIWSGWI